MILSNIEGLSKGSHTNVIVECDFQVSNKCRRVYQSTYKDYIRYNTNNNGNDICLYCSRKSKYSGRNNPNCKYTDINDNYFNIIDSEEKAYLLGWIASDGHIKESGFTISINKKDRQCLSKLASLLSNQLTISETPSKPDMIQLTVNSQSIAYSLIKLLQINFGKKSDKVRFPNLANNELKWTFLRGYFDGDGTIRKPDDKHRNPECGIASNSQAMLEDIASFCQIPSKINNQQINWRGNNALDFLGRLYLDSNIYLDRKYELYCIWSQYQPVVKNGCCLDNKIKVQYCHKDAIKPSKSRVSDSGYDITLIRKIKEENGIEYYGTGLKLCPVFGHHILMFPRSSMAKTGYILANQVAVIDRTYVGELIVALIKFNKESESLESKLPIKMTQIISQPIVHFEIEEVDNLDETERGEGGFGSTGQ